MRPMMFSALKALDPLHEEEERGENHDGQPDIDEVEHGALQGFLLVCAPLPGHPLGGRRVVGAACYGTFQVAVRTWCGR